MNVPHASNIGRPERRVDLITQLADRAELTELIFRVALCFDEHRFEDLAQLFVEDGVVVTPAGMARGRAALVAAATKSSAPFDRMHHVTTNVLIDFEDDLGDGRDADVDAAEADTPLPVAEHARIRANNLLSYSQGADPRPVATSGGVCLGKAVRTAEGWQLTEFEVRPTWTVQVQ